MTSCLKEKNIEEIKAELRTKLIFVIDSPGVIDWTVAYLDTLPKRSPSKQEFARKLIAHLARQPLLVRQRDFVERVINDRPRELEAVIRESSFVQMRQLMKWLRESNWKPKRHRITSDAERAARARESKRRHDRRRSLHYQPGAGLIEKHFSGDRTSADGLTALSEQLGFSYAGRTCLDEIFSGAEVHMWKGANSLLKLFGVGRKSLPRSLPSRRQGKARLYGYAAVLICMQMLLHSGHWLETPDRRQKVAANVIRRAHEVAPAENAAAVEMMLTPFAAP
jgi:hypothetical protein